ncbi:MAG: Rieske 2Fe-2S domain-containing protein [Gammaproteobacteria bacterium]|nr:Rieske 2Fe-2S domain-containing protein [Gammaproteobacteria bacterium]
MSADTQSRFSPGDLVQPGRVHKRVYTDPEIFELEMERLWRRTWLYVGHESQVPLPGSYFAATLARQPVMMLRHSDGSVRVFYNRCAHKGAMVVCDESGRVERLRCAYHGWTYATDGTLLHTPQPEGYAGCGFGAGHRESSLRPLGRVASYRGFVFASMNPDVPDLQEWLGQTRATFDNAVDRSPEGVIEVTGGVLRYVHDANWKILLENVSDNMHPMVTHQSAIQPVRVLRRDLPRDAEIPLAVTMIEPFGGGYDFFDQIGHTVCGEGHSYTGGSLSIHSEYPEVPEYLAAMERRHGAERTREILSVQRHNTIVYPSMSLKCALQTVRVYRPLAVDRTVQETWTFRLKGAPGALLERAAFYNHLIFSPASIAGNDDWEAYHRIQQGLVSQGSDWVSQHRHLDTVTENSEGSRSAPGTSDIVFRHEFAAWKRYLTAEA